MIKNAAIRSGSNRGLLLLALVLGVVSAVLVGVFLSQSEKGGGGSLTGPSAPAVVAAQDIPALTRITEEMVTVREMPRDLILAGVFTTTDGIVGQVTQVPITAGEQLLTSKVSSTNMALAQFGDEAPLSFTIPEGKRAFSVAVSAAGAAGGLVRPGDFVDVILSGSIATTEEGEQQTLIPSSACYVLQDIEVLAIGQSLKPVGTEGDPSGIASAGANAEAATATLAVTPEQAWRLAAAQEGVSGGGVGNPLWIALRPFGERGESGGIPVCDVKVGS